MTSVNTGPFAHVTSIGTACWTSQLLKDMDLKRYSCPFDWIFSAPKMVIHCLKDDFREFLSRDHYVSVGGPQEWTLPLFRDQYGLGRIVNHHDIGNEVDFDYLSRSVSRFRTVLADVRPKLFVIVSELKNVNDGEMDALVGALERATNAFSVLSIGFEMSSGHPGIDALGSIGVRDAYRLRAQGRIIDGLRFEEERDNRMLREIVGRYRFDLSQAPAGTAHDAG